MDNKQFGKVFGGVLGSALLVFGTANAGAYAVDEWVFPTAEYGDFTYIGTTDVSNMAVADAKTLFLAQASAGSELSELQVTYLDAMAKYPLKDVEISLDQTLEKAESGTQNNFVFDLSETVTRSFLKKQFAGVPFTEADIAAIHKQLETALESGQEVARVDISSDSLEMGDEKVAESSISHSIDSIGAEELIEVINGTVIGPKEQFQLLPLLEELTLLETTDAELTEIASVIYGAVLRSNFLVEQRSIGEKEPKNVPVGEEAAINRELGVDFAFSNPNASSFVLTIEKQAGSLTATIQGQPFVYAYDISTVNEETVEPRLIKQYSAFIESGKKVKQKGTDGKRIEVVRSVLEDGKEVRTESVSSDFYPPVHRVEVHALIKPEEPTTDANGEVIPQPGDEGFVDENNNGVHDPAEIEDGVETPSTGGGADGGSGDSPDSSDSPDEDQNTGGTQDDEDQEDGAVYDKAGYRVK